MKVVLILAFLASAGTADEPKFLDVKDCSDSGCEHKVVQVNPEYGTIQHESGEHLHSTFGAETNVVSNGMGVGADAQVHLAKIHQESGPASLDAVVGKVGVEGKSINNTSGQRFGRALN